MVLVFAVLNMKLKIYPEDATIMYPDLMPIIGREAIFFLYDFLWLRAKEETINIIGQ